MAILMLNNHDKKLLYYQIISSLLIYVCIRILLNKDDSICHIPSVNYSNKLGATKTYFALLLFFWIGLPATPSFINELYVLYSLSQINLCLLLIPLLGFICLAIAILHALQDHVFKISNHRNFKVHLGLKEHAFIWMCLIANIIAGTMPNALLNVLN